MTIPINTIFVSGNLLPPALVNRIQEMLAVVSQNVELSISGTDVVLTCSSADAACTLSIAGKLRYSESNKTVNFAGQPSGTYGIWATTTSNDADPSFTMSRSIAAPGGTYIRQLGSVFWSGSVLSDLRQITGYEKHSFMHGAGDALQAGSVALSMLAADALGAFAPTGGMVGFGGGSVPSGWLLCDGTAVSRATYATLFALIGTTYGAGDGSTTFNLPDARGRAIVGKGTHADVDNLADTEGNSVGSRTPQHVHTQTGHGHGKGSLSIGTSGSHTHSDVAVGDHTHQYNYGTVYVGSGGNATFNITNQGWTVSGFVSTEAGAHNHNIQSNTHSHPNGDITGNPGSGTAGDSDMTSNTQTASQKIGYLVANKIIKT